MPKDFFAFKQFAVKQDRASFKVGTDACLLAAWVNIEDEESMLDIGTGTGVIALMLAQRSKARIDGIDIDSENAIQASENMNASPWRKRLQSHHSSFQDWVGNTEYPYDHLISNPPFFEESTLNPDLRKQQSRHTTHLTFEELFSGAYRISTETGRISLVAPSDRFDDQIIAADKDRWFLERKCLIQPTSTQSANRVMTTFSKQEPNAAREQALIVYNEDRSYTRKVEALLAPFYLYL